MIGRSLMSLKAPSQDGRHDDNSRGNVQNVPEDSSDTNMARFFLAYPPSDRDLRCNGRRNLWLPKSRSCLAYGLRGRLHARPRRNSLNAG